jgi:hypothetical protein
MLSQYKSDLSEIFNDGAMNSSTLDLILLGMAENITSASLIFPHSCFLGALLNEFEEMENDHDRLECIKSALQFHKVCWSENMVQSRQRVVFVALLEPQKRWVTIGIDQTELVHFILGMDTDEEEGQVSTWPALMRLVCCFRRLFWHEISEPQCIFSVPGIPLLGNMCGLLAVENVRNFAIGQPSPCVSDFREIGEIRVDMGAFYFLGHSILESCRIRKRKQGHEEGASSNMTVSREKKERGVIDLTTEVEAKLSEGQCLLCSSIEGAFLFRFPLTYHDF